ncbi:hypothetical protein F4861DRAFT_500162 [Xylaria intraflava]|nr:hypothetical protein F4861DRAFT_500162 [Xylaria intraflava]
MAGQLEALRAQLKKALDQIESFEAEEKVSKSLTQSLEDEIADLNKKLEKYTKGDQDADDNDDDDGNDDVVKAIRKLLRTFLTIKTPSIEDINNLLVAVIDLQKTMSGAIRFEEGDALADRDKKLDECEMERNRLRDENTRLGNENKRLEGENKRLDDENKNLVAEIATLTDIIADLNQVIGNNGDKAAAARMVLADEIPRVQIAIDRIAQAMGALAPGPQTDRLRTRAQGEIDSYSSAIRSMTTARDLLDELSRDCTAAQTRARQRKPARPDAKGPDANGPDANGPDANPAPGDNDAGAGGDPGGTFRLVLKKLRKAFVWIVLLAMFFVMLAVTIAEGRLYTEWRNANQHTRALWMAIPDREVFCLGAPQFDYFWDTLLLGLMSR